MFSKARMVPEYQRLPDCSFRGPIRFGGEDKSKGKCFSFIWKLENASYCWQSRAECIESPLFTVDEIQETKWKLQLYPSHDNKIGFWLQRQADNKCAESVIDCELAFISSDGTVLYLWEGKNLVIEKDVRIGTWSFAWRNEVFSERGSLFRQQDTLTTRCRVWKSVAEMSKDVQCFAHTHIVVEKKSFLWNIENFSTLETNVKKRYEIKSPRNGEHLMSLELFLTSGLIYDETVRLKVTPNFRNIKICSFNMSILGASKSTVKCFRDEFWHRDVCGSKDFTLFCKKSELMENKNAYLPNNALCLSCECEFSFGAVQEFDTVDSDRKTVAKKKSDHLCLDTENEFSVSKSILLDNLKSMLNDSCVSDVKLRTNSQTYPSHKFILSARSPVFKAMFSNDMKEKINECVDIEDLNDDTVLRMLHYIYSAEVEELEWANATELYVAADKYQILNLKDICSSYIKSNLSVNNACEALVLADLHQDEDLKGFVQDFIMRHGEDVINSEEWEQLAETNLKLAYETTVSNLKK